MNCDQATELLPWLLNGSLDGEERREVREHLAGCSLCRMALADTRLAWTVYAAHPPASALVAQAYGESVPGLDAAVLAGHVESCPQCAAEAELAHASRRLEELIEEDESGAAGAGGGIAFVDRPREAAARPNEVLAERAQRGRAAAGRGWRAAALAAGLAGVAALTGWTVTSLRVRSLEETLALRRPALGQPALQGQQAPPARTTAPVAPVAPAGSGGRLAQLEAGERAAREKLAALEAENRRLQSSVAELGRQAASAQERIASLGRGGAGGKGSAAAPLFASNAWTGDVFPIGSEAEMRGREAASGITEVPAGAPTATLSLASSHRERFPAYQIEIHHARGATVWRDATLKRDPKGDFVITLRRGALKPGDYTIEIFGMPPGGPRTLLDRYAIRVE